MENLAIICVLFLLGWFWRDSLRAREIATELCRAACARGQVQLLDQTVALSRLGLRWLPQGLGFRRVYRFDFSEEGVARRTGYLILIGQQLEEMSLGLPSQPGDA